MALPRPEDLAAALPRKGRILGIDLGTKTIGLALSDPSQIVASPIGTVHRVKLSADLVALGKVRDERAIAGIILGLPVNMDGTEGPRCQATRQFARDLARHLALPVAFWDERLSSAAVNRALIAEDMTRRRRAEVVDQAAAAYILQGALDALARIRTAPGA